MDRARSNDTAVRLGGPIARAFLVRPASITEAFLEGNASAEDQISRHRPLALTI